MMIRRAIVSIYKNTTLLWPYAVLRGHALCGFKSCRGYRKGVDCIRCCGTLQVDMIVFSEVGRLLSDLLYCAEEEGG